jgi:signal transduction histidine kinase
VLTRLHRTESFRLTAIVMAVIVGAMIVLMVPVYGIMHQAFRAELAGAVEQDLAAIEAGYRSEGVREAQEVIGQLLARPGSSNFYLLERRSGEKLAGNLPALPQIPGSFGFQMPDALLQDTHSKGDHQIAGRGTLLAPDLYLYAGRDSYTAIEAEEHALMTFAWVLLATIIVALGGGILVSRAFLGRMDAITKTCRAIIAGRFSDRVPERGSRGEFDQLVRTINQMLDRIAALMENVQQISNDIAHDLRTPLSRLRNQLELAQTEASSAGDYRRAITRAIDECETILATFSALLRIGQIEGASGNLPADVVDLSALLAELADIYKPAAEDGGFILATDIRPGIHVKGDRTLLSQVFANLIENAMAHTPIGTRITLALAKEGEAVLAAVGDDGPGIPAEEHERVLRRFYRCERSRSSPGSGLGLSLVAAIAQYHGASLRLHDNQPGLRVELRFA